MNTRAGSLNLLRRQAPPQEREREALRRERPLGWVAEDLWAGAREGAPSRTTVLVDAVQG
jgi:hypothetical protein